MRQLLILTIARSLDLYPLLASQNSLTLVFPSCDEPSTFHPTRPNHALILQLRDR